MNFIKGYKDRAAFKAKSFFSFFLLLNSVLKALIDKKLKNKKRSLPFLFIDITDKCNSRCLACPVWRPRPVSARELTGAQIISLLPSLKALGTRLVSFGGGEPLLRDDLFDCIRAFSDEGISTHINTNALLLNRHNIKKLIDSGLSSINISCDHIDPEKYFELRGVNQLHQVFAALKNISSCKRKIPVAVNVVVSRKNINDVEKIAALLAGFKVRKIQFIPINFRLRHRPEASDIIRLFKIIRSLRRRGIESNSDFFINHFDCAYKPLRPVACTAGTLFAMIDPFGNVSPCYEIGTGLNIKDMTLQEIVKHPKFSSGLQKVVRCRRPCWDTGSAEPSIRVNFSYAFLHPLETMKQVFIHLL
jgi:MoaA/NifB/PqqE/SkfB family radical SAM enzyme